MNARVEYATALVFDALAAGGALLVATREWQTITTSRARPFADDVLAVTGRTVDAAPTALALVALAGVVAVLATRGIARRFVGGLIALAGAGLVWRATSAQSPVSASRARDLVRTRHPRVSLSSTVSPHISTHGTWGALTIACGVIVFGAGLLVAVRSGRWAAMSARYETPATRADDTGTQVSRQKADASLWGALDRGEDPTLRDPRDAQ